MTAVSSTPGSWDERFERIINARPTHPEAALSIDVVDLVVGDQLLISAEPFIVTHCEPDGPIIGVEATRGTRTIQNDYLRIERVDVLCPRPPAADDRKARP
jgi:hypothetical protein